MRTPKQGNYLLILGLQRYDLIREVQTSFSSHLLYLQTASTTLTKLYISSRN